MTAHTEFGMCHIQATNQTLVEWIAAPRLIG